MQSEKALFILELVELEPILLIVLVPYTYTRQGLPLYRLDGRAGSGYYSLFAVCISLTEDRPQRARLRIPPINISTETLQSPSCLWSLKIFPSLPGSRLLLFIAMQAQRTLTPRQPIING